MPSFDPAILLKIQMGRAQTLGPWKQSVGFAVLVEARKGRYQKSAWATLRQTIQRDPTHRCGLNPSSQTRDIRVRDLPPELINRWFSMACISALWTPSVSKSKWMIYLVWRRSCTSIWVLVVSVHRCPSFLLPGAFLGQRWSEGPASTRGTAWRGEWKQNVGVQTDGQRQRDGTGG